MRPLNPLRLSPGIAVCVSGLILALAVWVALPRGVTHAIPTGAPSDGCGAVSCTLFLPIVFKSSQEPTQLEMTQAVQQPDNSVLLVANRLTFARLTLTSTTAYTNVTAYLYGTRDGSLLPGSPIAALNNPRTLKSTVNRGALNDTFNFQLPSAWLNGTIQLYGSASGPGGFSFSGLPVTFQFVPANPMNVTIVPIAYTCTSGGSGTITPPGPYAYLTDFTFRVYPVASIPTATHASLTYSGPCYNSLPDPTSTDWNNMLYAVRDTWFAEGRPNRYYYGLVKIDCTGGCISGIGYVGGNKAAVGFDGIGASHSSASETHAHEVGHNHGRWHAPGCGAADPDLSFPYVTDGKGYIGNSAHPNYGFDIKAQAIYPYSTYYDMMSYCGPEWVSDYTYEALWDYDNLYMTWSDAPTGRALMVSGQIDPVTDRVTFQPAYALDLPLHLPAPGDDDYVLELLDAEGRVIGAHPFEPVRAQADRFRGGTAFESASFVLTVPYDDQIASLRVRRGDAILGALTAGAQAPSLEAGTAVLRADSRVTLVTWSGQDADGDELRYLVRASTDGGVTWQVIGVNLTTPTIELRSDEWSGQSVLVQVLASDGVHSRALSLGTVNVP